MNVNFYRAADAFLYLPTYIAEYRGIYEEISKTLKVSFNTPERPDSGDLPALRSMINDSRKGDTLPIAICDPFVMFSSGLHGMDIQPTDLRVLGAIITKVPFWAIDSKEGEISEDEFGKEFKRIIYYNEKLRTGHYIGARTAHLANINDVNPVYFGQEFETLFRNREKRTLAVTCDVISMGIFHDYPDKQKQISVNHCYSNNPHYKNFVTTALVTTAEVCKKYPEYTAEVLQGVQASLGILRSSREIALSVCKELAEENEFYGPQHLINGQMQKLTDDQVEWIIDRIYEGDFYPNTLEITKIQWEETLESHAVGYGFGRKAFDEGKSQYDTIVDMEYLLNGQRKYLKSVGVSIDRLVEVEIKAQKLTVEELIAKSREEEIKAQRLPRYQQWASQGVTFIGALIALFLCFRPENKSLPILVIISLLIACYPVYLIGGLLRRRINFLDKHAILWLWTLACAGLSVFLFFKGYFSSDDSVFSNRMFVLCGLAATVAAVPLSILVALKLQSHNDE